MNPGTTACLLCPACGQAFLSMQQSLAGVAQCPHCAHSGSRAQFGTQVQVAGVTQERRRVAQTQPLQSMTAPLLQPPQSVPQPAAWPGLQPMPEQAPTASIARMTLQHSQALMPTGAPAPAAEFTAPPHLRTSSWKHAFILLAFAVVCGGAIWLWWDQANAPAFATKAAAAPLPAAAETRNAQPITKTAPAVAVMPLPDVAAIAADAKALVTELFAADTPERRTACFHDAEKYRAEIETLFGAAAEKIELRLLARIPGMPLTLPGGQPVPLFKLVTSKCPNGALIRLETGADGKRHIHWPLFLETHESKLAGLFQNTGAEAAWMHVGLRPSHGLDIPAELRAKYLTFDVQVSASSDPHFVACVERDTPLGRLLDRETEWGKAYLARLLVRKLDIQADAPCVIVLDCEGAREK
ncbi:MAG: hypothetical protein ACKVY0_13135 [Prosthecobacter sp.]|uniref:hypothetical protein n=1 Tax=Prosthecobacter sp. TaxID=1965333 RepID=UPI0038FEDBA8